MGSEFFVTSFQFDILESLILEHIFHVFDVTTFFHKNNGLETMNLLSCWHLKNCQILLDICASKTCLKICGKQKKLWSLYNTFLTNKWYSICAFFHIQLNCKKILCNFCYVIWDKLNIFKLWYFHSITLSKNYSNLSKSLGHNTTKNWKLKILFKSPVATILCLPPAAICCTLFLIICIQNCCCMI